MKPPVVYLYLLVLVLVSYYSHADRIYDCDQCLNGGKCLVHDESEAPTCMCTTNSSRYYTGAKCEIQVVNCVGNKNFTCYNGGECSGDVCSCPSSWTGSSCDTSINENSQKTVEDSDSGDKRKPKWYLLMIGIIATVTLGGLFLTILLSFRRKSNQASFVDMETSTQQMG